MEIIITLVFGIVIGLGFGVAFAPKPKAIGTLRVDHSDPDEPYLFLQLSSNVSDISTRKYVTFDVKVENFVSQK